MREDILVRETLSSSIPIHNPVRVVITGVGAVTASGLSATALWEGVKSGQVAIRQVTRDLPMETYPTQLGGEVQAFAGSCYDYHRATSYQEPTIEFALKAAEEALTQSGLGFSLLPKERCGVIIGTCMAGLMS